MEKYEPLAESLRESWQVAVARTPDQVEPVLGAKRPRSAFKDRPRWSNSPANQVTPCVWLGARYRTVNVDMPGRKRVFRKIRPEERSSAPGGGQPAQKEASPVGEAVGPAGLDSHLFGALIGPVTLAAGTGLTGPVDKAWNRAR